MPTSAGPNISGEENLVFGYDLSDQKNSYLGEPTTNLAVAPLNITSGYSSAAGITRTTGTELNFTGQNNAGLISRSGGGGWTAYTGGVSGAGNGVRFTTTWYLKAGTATTVFVNWGGAHTGNRTDFVVDLTTGAVSSVTIASGEFYKVERVPNGFYRIMYSSTLTASTYFPQISPVASTGTIIFGGIQIERNSHATPFTIGTRSGTQGLIDLIGNSTIDISNVSFDNSAQMTFDGTNDVISIPTNSVFNTNIFSVESVFKLSTYDNQHRTIAARNASVYSHSNGWWMGTLRNGLGNNNNDFRVFFWGDSSYVVYNTSSGGNDGRYHHMIISCDGVTVFFYVDGQLSYSASKPSGNLYSSSENILIGQSPVGDNWSGDIQMVKFYNRSLSSSEVLNNYNNIKRKYGI
jgi:hypothetical protein